ncbi:alanine racemase [Paenibacillus filicis]|uniref:Alanine racemase n=1 Tax=Paenibacillus gyeongsangnamensis TaxID=3388067 RepID=A0ABT4Q3U9_9BACL|nr:alanine racemase [Paenibacillus filicis]MCZ8511514.1 alanine racemase [Paenibacillus filicis]
MYIHELDTPAVVIDQAKAGENLIKMQSLADRRGVALRPHIKTHKSVYWAKRQIALGAVGITVAKLSEAETMARHGIQNIYIAYPLVGKVKIARLQKLLETSTGYFRFTVDSECAVDALAEAVTVNDRTLDFMIEVDTGMNRCGVISPEAAVKLAEYSRQYSKLNLVGIMTHAGHAHNTTDETVIRDISHRETRSMIETADALKAAGFGISVISAGSTITSEDALQVPGLTEIRSGTYIFNDLRTEELHKCQVSDIAATIIATVVSRPSPDRLVIDAGSKTLTPTRDERYGYGLVPEFPDLRIVRLSEEHGVCEVSPTNSLKVGDRIEILPVHVCVVMNMCRETYLCDGDRVLQSIPVEAHLCNK